MNRIEEINKALAADTELSREEYAEKMKVADRVTAAHGIEGEAPLSEEERERRMRMNYYGTVINVMMSVLAALDDIAERLTTLNNNIVTIAGGGAADERNDTRAGE